MPATSKSRHRVIRSSRVPQISETRHERVNAAVWTAFLGLLGLCVAFATLWLMMPEKVIARTPPEEIIHIIEKSDPNYDLKPIVLESPEDQQTNELQTSENLQDLMSTVQSTDLVSQTATASAGLEGEPEKGESVDGTGDSIESRQIITRGTWLFEISVPLTRTEYIQLLDQMGLQLAAVYSDGRVVYLDNLSGTPSTKTDLAAKENRFYTQWNNGNLLQFDRDMFAEAGVDVSSAKLVQLFSPELEGRLQQLAAEASEQPKADHRTWFRLVRSGSGFEFQVRQRSQN